MTTLSDPCSGCFVRPLGLCEELLRDEALQGPNRIIPKTHAFARARRTIYRARTHLTDLYVLCDGWAVRQMILPDGRRQILSFGLPGDSICVSSVFQQRLQFSIMALTDTHYCRFDRAAVAERLTADRMLQMKFVEINIKEREAADRRLTDLGRRSAVERIARFILEFHHELKKRGSVLNDRFELPLRQQHIADTLGLTPTHVSRVFTIFRQRNMVHFDKGEIEICDYQALVDIAGEPAFQQ